MALWSINAAKNKDEMSAGTSKWITRELHALHKEMVDHGEQFAYSVLSEFAWLDAQMDEILSAEQENPRLLLESPQKLRGQDSPVKKLREQQVALMSPKKSPMKELDVNALKLSPIKFHQKQQLSPTPQMAPLSPQKTKSTRGEPTQKLNISNHSNSTLKETSKSHNPFIEAPQPESPTSLISNIERPPTTKSTLKQALRIYSPDEKPKTKPPSKSSLISSHSDDDHDDYDASIDETSFQAIRTKIRKSLAKRAYEPEPKHEQNTTGDSSYKSADEGSRASSMVAQPSSSAPVVSSVASLHSMDSVETIKVPLRDEIDNKKRVSILSKTPPPAKRESQGFALLPHRDPLTVKSAKKTDSSKPRFSLFADDFNPGSSKEENTSPQITQKSLYPTLSVESSNPPTVSTITSPLPSLVPNYATKNPSPTKLKPPSLVPLKSRLASPEKPKDDAASTVNEHVSPIKVQPTDPPSPKRGGISPISNIFASVNTTLKKAKSKFIKETDTILDPKMEVTPPVNELANKSMKSPVEETHLSSRSISPETKTVPPVETKSNDVDMRDYDDDDDDLGLKRDSLKFTPVKSAYGSLRMEMAENSAKKTEIKATTKATDVQQPEKKVQQQPRGLTRVSLTRPDDNQKPRKSRGGLTSVTLDASKKKPRPKSLVGEQSTLPTKRKSQADDEVRTVVRGTANQPYRKIGTKIVAPTVNKNKQEQQDAKRRLTAEKIQSVYQKRASRISHTEQEPARVIKPVPKHAAPTNQTLMKTAVLQHARMNNETKSNPFQSGSASNFHSSNGFTKINPPVTPSTTTKLPEIYSESDDDDEGSVLKDWANSPELKHLLMEQRNVDPDQVFGPIAPLRMEEIFEKSSGVSKLRHRGSSAQWTRDGLTQQEIENYKSRTYNKR